MTPIDQEADSIKAKLAQLSPGSSEEIQPKSYMKRKRFAHAGLAVIAGIAIGAAGIQVASSAMAKNHPTRLSDQTLEWITYEIAQNRDITPTLARRILEQQIRTKRGAH